jgi:arylsulfatase A-like enzyme
MRINFNFSNSLWLFGFMLPVLFSCKSREKKNSKPNFIVIFCDDLGYGDLGCFGSEVHQTPHIDQMAEEGVKLTSFYSTCSVSTPSRASLLTGCYPQRIDMAEMKKEGFRSVLTPRAHKGLNPSEITIAEILKKQGYATACIGKWHLGDQPKFLPTRQGFDTYYGIPYSNNMSNPDNPLPLLGDEEIIEAPVDQNTITKRYTREAIDFIKENSNQPFFIYLPHTMPHNPVHTSEKFRGQSDNGLYGDAVEEIDWSVGEILQCLKKEGLDEQTMVVFTSDNGAAEQFGGSNKPLSGWKGRTMEGGMRVPCIMRWPGKIPQGRKVDEITSTMDLLPTIHSVVYQESFDQRMIDGHNIFPLLSGKSEKSVYEAFFYYDRDQLQAVRSGKWKLVLSLENRFKAHYTDETEAVETQLYNLKQDIGEEHNVASEHPQVVEDLMRKVEIARKTLGSQDNPSEYVRPAGRVVAPESLQNSKNE